MSYCPRGVLIGFNMKCHRINLTFEGLLCVKPSLQSRSLFESLDELAAISCTCENFKS
ncbi:hypothetical protein X975_15139, partial [Stegodyphus mimosarum]